MRKLIIPCRRGTFNAGFPDVQFSCGLSMIPFSCERSRRNGNYYLLQLELIRFEAQDVITTSNGEGGGGDFGEDD